MKSNLSRVISFILFLCTIPQAHVLARVTWYRLYLGDTPAGYGKEIRHISGKIEKLEFENRLRLNVYGDVKDIIIQGEGEFYDGKLRYLQVTMQGEAPVSYEVKAVQGALQLKRESPAGSRTFHVNVPRGSWLVTPYNLNDVYRKMLKSGHKKEEVLLFDPMMGQPVKTTVEYAGKKSMQLQGRTYSGPAFITRASGTSSLSIVDPRTGEVIFEKDATGLVAVRSPEPVKIEELTAAGTRDLIAQYAVPYSGPDPRKYTKATYRVSGVKITDLPIEGFRQHVKGELITVFQESIPARGYTIPYTGNDMAEYLAEDPLINPHDPAVKRAALKAAGSSKDAVEVVKKLTTWVYSNIAKEPVVSIPDPGDVLRSGKGDCNEHAVLLASMLRALGIPARVAVGLVYSEGRFFYHAWVEAYVGQWLSSDPVFGQVPADVSHIRFSSGDISKWMEVARLMGRVKLEWVAKPASQCKKCATH